MRNGKIIGVGCGMLLLLLAAGCASVGTRADHALRNGRFQEAVSLYREHLSREPDAVESRARLGYAYLKMDRPGDAIRELEAVLDADPGNPYAVLYLGLARLNNEDLSGALELWRGYRNPDRPIIETEIRRLLTLLKLAESKRTAREAVRREGRLPTQGPAPNTIAVAYYEDMTPDKRLGSYRKGLSALIITYLSEIDSLQVVERMKLQALIEEIEFGETGMVDRQSAPRVGQLIGAENLVTGKLALGSVEALSTVTSTTRGGIKGVLMHSVGEKDFFDLPIFIVRDILTVLNIALTPAEKAAIESPLTRNLQAFIYYGQALQAADSGNWKLARYLFEKALQEDPGFDPAMEGRDALPEIDFTDDMEGFREMQPQYVGERLEPVIEEIVAENRLMVDPDAQVPEGAGGNGTDADTDGDPAHGLRPDQEEEMDLQEIIDRIKEESGRSVEFEW